MRWLAETFQGLTARRFAFFCLVVTFIALHQGVAVYGMVHGKTWGDKTLAALRSICTMLLVFVPVLLAVVAVANRGPRRGTPRIVWLAVALVAGHTVGAFLWIHSFAILYPAGDLPPSGRITEPLARLRFFGGKSVYYLVYSVVALVICDFIRKRNVAMAAIHREQMRREEIERENAEARLQVMQAQIEPHFLFNTLASVRRLYQTDRGAGRAMLQHLTRYLTSSLPSMRETRSTLDRELALATAYLSVHKIRMDGRLEFAVDVPAHLRGRIVPPMMIATLVENAIIHGLTPMPAGGTIRIVARERDHKLVIEVIDDGRGLHDSWGGGVGLNNIRSRLASAYGMRAELALVGRADGGVIAALALPQDDTEAAKAA